ncbi:hypothetical protein [Cupriavidus pauculus]|jgi:hypothetical protein|uniref:hypothetical protein n=1 Tax=Cupriavidus pauculus TaxID=82633 RepID=UPI0012483412|nr:hypothetical protein [Cupriavidus pauculus]KAB0602576.1 hypothetical protein F7R19_12250 [Cupriavidus pauculus]MCM3604292.1 hypothetical protein [Cupriavidus pauculus]UAK98335.1 hypothetical protein K8O84_09825 [Cupriavidus pauculus]
MSRHLSRTPFFKSNRVRKRRVAGATAGVVAAITAATVFLCIRPAAVPHDAAAASPASTDTATADRSQRRAAVAAEAMASGALVTLADRHAADAVRMADASDDTRQDDLGWDYVQLRL